MQYAAAGCRMGVCVYAGMRVHEQDAGDTQYAAYLKDLRPAAQIDRDRVPHDAHGHPLSRQAAYPRGRGNYS